jgi:hypothetical protein
MDYFESFARFSNVRDAFIMILEAAMSWLGDQDAADDLSAPLWDRRCHFILKAPISVD